LYTPASSYTFVGILSSSAMPSPVSPGDCEDPCIVPTIHVLAPALIAYPSSGRAYLISSGDATAKTRAALIEYLATAFSPPDQIAAEYLLLLLLSTPTARPTSLPPLGTIAINFLRPASSASPSTFTAVVSSISPLVVPLPLSISLLNSSTFYPVSTDSSNLDAGILQLGEGTVLIVEEDEMGEGGQLDEKAVKNIKALIDCVEQQKLRYEYPFMDDLKMDCHLRVAVFSEGKSLLPVSEKLDSRSVLISSGS